MKKIIAVLLSVLMLALCFPAVVLAAEPNEKQVISGICGDELKWNLSDDVLTISGTGGMQNYSRSQSPFRSLDYSILIVEDGAESIGSFAFAEPDDETPKLRYISLPPSLLEIGEGAFYGCTGLTHVTIPENVKDVGDGAFAFCTGLKGFTVDTSNYKCFSQDGLLFKEFYDVENEEYKTVLIQCPAGYSGTAVSLPDVDEIRPYAFSGCRNLSSIDIPYTVKAIGKAAFADCSALRNASISKAVTQISEDTFSGCTALARVDISKRLKQVGARAFSGCAQLKDIYYSGTQAQWDALPIGAENNALKSAQIHCDCCVVTLAVEQPEGYTITVTGDGIYTVGDTVTMAAVPVTHIDFDKWEIDGDLEYASTEYSFTAEDHVLVSAFFSESFRWVSGDVKYVTVHVLVVSDNGSTASAGGDYYPNETVTLTAQASEKEVFVGWYEGDMLLSTDPTCKLSAEKDMTVRAVFSHEALKEIQVVDFVQLRPRQVFTLEPETEYSDPQSLRLIYKSSDTRTAQVDQNGNVTAHKPGTAKITVIAIDEYGNIASDVCTVRVRYCWCQWLTIIFLFGWIWY